MLKGTTITKVLVTGILMFTLVACAGNPVATPRPTSVYDTTGFGGTKKDASKHAIQNANMTCGRLPVNIVSDTFNQAQYKDASSIIYEVNMRYRCGSQTTAQATL